MDAILEWCKYYEPLFLPVLAFECLVSLVGTVFLVLEYFWGRPDVAIKNEQKQYKRVRAKKEEIPYEKDMD